MPVVEKIEVELDADLIGRALRLDRSPSSLKIIGNLIEDARSLIEPRAFYGVIDIEARTAEGIRAGGIFLPSRVLSVAAKASKSIFPYVLTIGSRLEERAGRSGDLLEQFRLETAGDMALAVISGLLEAEIRRNFGLEMTGSLSPGSLEDWPVSGQKELFELLGDGSRRIGIDLTSRMLMIPRKSISGVIFAVDSIFSACGLCPRPRCPGRKAPFDARLKRKYRV